VVVEVFDKSRAHVFVVPLILTLLKVPVLVGDDVVAIEVALNCELVTSEPKLVVPNLNTF
jgi:hypothetical protein